MIRRPLRAMASFQRGADSKRRVEHLAWMAAALVVVLASRVAWMQVLEGEAWKELATRNSIRNVPFRATRGLLLDRHLRVLASNTPSLSVGLVPAELPRDKVEAERVLDEIAILLDLETDEVRQKLARQRTRPFAPARLAVDVERSVVAAIEERRKRLPGVVVLRDTKRVYPKATAAHALGYVGEISQRQLARMVEDGYRLGDLIGQTGIESVYDQDLKGVDGGRQVRINASGRELGLMADIPAQAGDDLVLTLDARVQAAAEEALGREAGAIVALDPRNGEVLALVSKPDFDPNIFAGRIRAKDWKELLDDERKPMNNRALQGLFPPGSVFKLVTAIAALESGVITPETHFECLGIYWIATWPYRCWKEIGHGSVSLDRAIPESCDIFFYQTGLRLKVDRLQRWAHELGFGSKTGIDLPSEAQGLVPDPAWKERTQQMPWFPGNTVMMSIGQGYLLATPLQLAVMVATIANGGIRVTPHLVKRVLASDGSVVREIDVPPAAKVRIHDETLRLIQNGMEAAVQDRRGTAWRSRVQGLSVAGKTGTAQNPHGEDHATFVTFAPLENPQIAIAVIVENGGEGGLTAAPMAKKVMEAYFKD